MIPNNGEMVCRGIGKAEVGGNRLGLVFSGVVKEANRLSSLAAGSRTDVQMPAPAILQVGTSSKKKDRFAEGADEEPSLEGKRMAIGQGKVIVWFFLLPDSQLLGRRVVGPVSGDGVGSKSLYGFAPLDGCESALSSPESMIAD